MQLAISKPRLMTVVAGVALAVGGRGSAAFEGRRCRAPSCLNWPLLSSKRPIDVGEVVGNDAFMGRCVVTGCPAVSNAEMPRGASRLRRITR